MSENRHSQRADTSTQISISLSKADLQAIEQARGDTNRSEFLVLAATGRLPKPTMSQGSNFRIIGAIENLNSLLMVTQAYVVLGEERTIVKLEYTPMTSGLEFIIEGYSPNFQALIDFCSMVMSDQKIRAIRLLQYVSTQLGETPKT